MHFDIIDYSTKFLHASEVYNAGLHLNAFMFKLQ